MLVYVSQRYYFEVSSQFVIPLPSEPLDRALVFPLAVVPTECGGGSGVDPFTPPSPLPA